MSSAAEVVLAEVAVVMGVAMVEVVLEGTMEAITEEVVALGAWEVVALEAFQAPVEEDTAVTAEALEEWVVVLEEDSAAVEGGMEGLVVVASGVQGEVVVDGKPFTPSLKSPPRALMGSKRPISTGQILRSLSVWGECQTRS